MMLVSLVAVCASVTFSQAAEPEPIRIVAQGLPAPAATDVTAIAQRAVLRAFLERYPQYVVEPFTMPEVRGQGLDSGPLMAIAAGIPPHAIYVNFRQSSTYIAQGFLEPVEILLARVLSDDPQLRETDAWGQWLADPSPQAIEQAVEAIRERVPGPAWPVVYREDESGQLEGDHVWAIPQSSLVMALLYRKDLFHAAGLDPERPPQTWDELLDYARRLTVPERQQYGMMLYGGQDLSWSCYTFLVSNGVRAVGQNEQGEWRATYGTREAAEAAHFIWRMAREPFERDGQTISGATRIGTSEIWTMWDRGQVGMQFNYLAEEMLANLNPQLVGIAPVPRAGGGERGSEVNCQMLGIFSGATPEQKLGVMRFIWFITSDEAKRIRTDIYIDHGFGQFVSPDLLRKFGHDRILRRVPPGWQEAFDQAMEAGVPEPYGRNTQNIYRYMSEPIHATLEMNLEGVEREQAIDQIERHFVASAEQVNRDVLTGVPEEQMRFRRGVAWVAIVLVVIAFIAGFGRIWYDFAQQAPPAAEGSSQRRYIAAYLILAPALGLTLLWGYLPLILGASMATQDYRLAMDNVFVGVDNFANVLFEPAFWTGLSRTLYFVTLAIVLGFWPPILLAILLDEVPTAVAKYIFRTLFYLPAIVSGVIIMFLWKQLYDPSEAGVLNQLLLSLNWLDPVSATVVKLLGLFLWLSLAGGLWRLSVKLDELGVAARTALKLAALVILAGGIWPIWQAVAADGAGGLLAMAFGRFSVEPLRWVQSPEMAMACVVIPTVWAGAGPGCLLYLAALKTIPSDLYEAADIDGAGPSQKIFYITLPRLKYLITIQFIAAVVGAFKGGADMILAMTGGGPNNATMILALEIFVRTFLDLQFGVGAAMAWLLGAVLIGFTAYQMRMLSRAEFSAAGSTDNT